MNTQTSTPEFLAALNQRFLVAEGTLALQFRKPDGFTFRAGQYHWR